MTVQTITPKQLHDIVSKDSTIELIDVRTPFEFQEVHAKIAKNLPLDAIDPKSHMESRSNSESPLYVICKSGARAQKACEKFIAAGFTNVINVEGGTSAWDQSSLPVNRGKKVMSLERQVRIAAGFLVLLGAVLAMVLNNPYYAGLSAFVGAGLMFAGITDTCGLAMVIAKMPWNQQCVSTCSPK